jgi:hypothetical protein
MQNRNAMEGARMGGVANNPSARGGNQPQNIQALMFALRKMMAGQQTQGLFGR